MCAHGRCLVWIVARLEEAVKAGKGRSDRSHPGVRKAIGWVLRETGKRQPDLVAAWLAPRTAQASGVTMREAVKWLPADRRAALTAAYRGRNAG